MLKFLLYIMFNYKICNRANECSVKTDVWICLTSFTKTTETKCDLPFLYFFSKFTSLFFTCSYLLHCIHDLI